MPAFTSHNHGTFCWPELATTDQKSAVAFYRGLFGWGLDDKPAGPGATYSMFTVDGRHVGAAASLQPAEREHGVPAHWNNYIAVASADDAVKRAQALGAKVLAPAFDVMDSGRMAVLQDPTGATFNVWQAGTHIGTELLNENGALCWTELYTRDTNAAETFYTSLFGWTAKRGTAGMEYTEFSNKGVPQGGMMAITPEMGKMPPFWMPYFKVADCDAVVNKAKETGGRLHMGPHEIPNVGRFAIMGDPQGAGFAVIKMAHA